MFVILYETFLKSAPMWTQNAATDFHFSIAWKMIWWWKYLFSTKQLIKIETGAILYDGPLAGH